MDQQAKLEAYRKRENVVPPVVYQTWHTKDMHYVWVEQFRTMKELNSHIEFKLFTDQECREYIKANFDNKVLWAYDTLAPTAFKADLWRYCVLYKEGGVYLDIKLLCYEIDLLRKEKFLRVEDIPQVPCQAGSMETYFDEDYYSKDLLGPGLWQAVMASVAGNGTLKQAIDSVVDKVFNSYYGFNPLCITGPIALCSVVDDNKIPTGEMKLHKIHTEIEWIHVVFHGVPIIKLIDYYRCYSNHNYVSNMDHTKRHYAYMWKSGLVYKPHRITPSRIIPTELLSKSKGILNVCNLSNGLYLVEKPKSKLSMIDDITLVTTGNLVSNITIFDNRTKRHEYVPFPPCDEEHAISGFRDPKVYHGSVTFNAKVNGGDFTVFVPSSMNIKNTNTWIPVQSSQLSFFNIRDKEYCVTSWTPHIEIARFTKSSSEPLTERKTVFKYSGCAHTDWATNGIKIDEEIWFLCRRTVRRKPKILYDDDTEEDIDKYFVVSYCYYWVVLCDSLTSIKRSCVFQPSTGSFHKVSNVSYDVTTNMISIDATSYDKWSQTLVFSKDSFDDLIWL